MPRATASATSSTRRFMKPRRSSLKVRREPVNSTWSGMMLERVPPWMVATVDGCNRQHRGLRHIHLPALDALQGGYDLRGRHDRINAFPGKGRVCLSPAHNHAELIRA